MPLNYFAAFVGSQKFSCPKYNHTSISKPRYGGSQQGCGLGLDGLGLETHQCLVSVSGG